MYELPTDAPRIDWQGESPWTAEELTRHRLSPERRRARDFLRLLLKEGPRPLRAIRSAAEEAGLSEGTLRRARKDLRVRRQQCYDDGVRNDFWLLPGQQMPDDPHSETPELDDWLRRWREMYPARHAQDSKEAG